MKIVRVFSGDDGESHFEDVSPEEMAEIVNRVGAGDITLGLRLSQRPPAAVCGQPIRYSRVRMCRRVQMSDGTRRYPGS